MTDHAMENALTSATPRENLEGSKPELASPEQLAQAVEKAFEYRGDVTLTLTDGRVLDGYIFDRQSLGAKESFLRMFPRDSLEKIQVYYHQITQIHFSGRDTAAGKSFETWVKLHGQRKARGETNISLDPEPLDWPADMPG